jgi:transcriptional regulator with XRE-family HTH domain
MNNLSQTELALRLGITRFGINNYEKGFNAIYYEMAMQMADLLKINPELLLDDYTRFCKPGYGDKIKTIRKAYNYTQNEFASKIGTDRSTVAIWECEYKNHHPGKNLYEIIIKMAREKGIKI